MSTTPSGTGSSSSPRPELHAVGLAAVLCVPGAVRGNSKSPANRRQVRGPAIPPVDELGGQDQGDGQSHLGHPMCAAAVGIAPHLPVVREPRVGPLDGPAQSEGDFDVPGFCSSGLVLALALGDDEVALAPLGATGPDPLGVIATVEVQSAEVGEEPWVATVSRVGPKRLSSWRLAPPPTQPMGIPAASVAMDHFHRAWSDRPGSVRFLPLQLGLCALSRPHRPRPGQARRSCRRRAGPRWQWPRRSRRATTRRAAGVRWCQRRPSRRHARRLPTNSP